MNKQLKIILKEMCKRVGMPFNRINFKEKEWFMKKQWSEIEQNKFRQWLVGYLTKEKEARTELMRIHSNNKRLVESFADQFILDYGWKVV